MATKDFRVCASPEGIALDSKFTVVWAIFIADGRQW